MKSHEIHEYNAIYIGYPDTTTGTTEAPLRPQVPLEASPPLPAGPRTLEETAVI